MTIPVLFGAALAAVAPQAPAATAAPQPIQIAAAPEAQAVPASPSVDPQRIQDTSAPQSTPPPAPEPTPLAARLDDKGAPAEAGRSVSRYDQSFFAAMRPNTARDMIQRLPGFTFK